MKKIFLTLLIPLLCAACTGVEDSGLVPESFETELANEPTAENPEIVNGTKLNTTSGNPDDVDLDSIPDESDNCPTVSNTDQTDLNDDAVGDACADSSN